MRVYTVCLDLCVRTFRDLTAILDNRNICSSLRRLPISVHVVLYVIIWALIIILIKLVPSVRFVSFMVTVFNVCLNSHH